MFDILKRIKLFFDTEPIQQTYDQNQGLEIQNDSLVVCILDKEYGGAFNTEDEWEEANLKQKRQLEHKFQTTFLDVDVTPGASGPAFGVVVEVLSEYWPIVVAAFFSAKPIKDNWQVWADVFKRLKPFVIQDGALLNQNAAAVLAVNAIFDEIGQAPKEIQLSKYFWMNRFDENEDSYQDEFARSGPRIEYLGWAKHVFEIQADDQKFMVFVTGSEVILERIVE